jgi:fructose-1,6-bisphosphatase/inositol monophosphatase family enzyme
MSAIDPHDFIEILLPTVRRCAQASLIFFGQVANMGKAEDAQLGEPQAERASGVLTALDNAVQDIVLGTVAAHFPQVELIAEENTPMKRRFAANKSEYCLIIDPIDGTLHFQKGDAPYHVCVGLAHNGRMLASIIARPDEDKIFTAVRGQGAYVQTGKRRRRLRLPKKPRTDQAFISSKARQYVEEAGKRFKPREYPIGAALVLTLMAEGELAAYMTRQVEIYDVGPPSLIAEEAGARCFGRQGQELLYTKRRKLPYFLAAPDEDSAAFVLDVVQRSQAAARTTNKGKKQGKKL